MRIAGLFSTMINMQQSPEVGLSIEYSHINYSMYMMLITNHFFLEIKCPALEQHQGVHRSDGAGGGGEGEDVPGDHGGLPDLLGTALPRHPGQLELGVEGRQEVDVSRGEGKVELAIHLLLHPKVSLHVAFVHSFVNPLLFVVLHKGCR